MSSIKKKKEVESFSKLFCKLVGCFEIEMGNSHFQMNCIAFKIIISNPLSVFTVTTAVVGAVIAEMRVTVK